MYGVFFTARAPAGWIFLLTPIPTTRALNCERVDVESLCGPGEGVGLPEMRYAQRLTQMQIEDARIAEEFTTRMTHNVLTPWFSTSYALSKRARIRRMRPQVLGLPNIARCSRVRFVLPFKFNIREVLTADQPLMHRTRMKEFG